MEILYNIFIQPLVFIIDVLFVVLYDAFLNPALVVVFLSIIVNLIALPLYRTADKIQKSQQLKQKEMQPVISHIKSTFKGDEQYMMLSAYYRVEHYHPLSVLKESFPLLLQIPIFIAAYRYLSSATVLVGASFGYITDLGSPDGLLSIGTLSINILPILMTVLNLLSGFVYSRNKTVSQKIQIIVIAVIFLVLLYNSPAGLVLYWTTSQVFSLCKNLVLEAKALKNHIFRIIVCLIAISLAVLGVITQVLTTKAGVIVAEALIILGIIGIISVVIERKQMSVPDRVKRKLQKVKNYWSNLTTVRYSHFIIVCLCCVLLFGFVIPSSVLSASAKEFIDTTSGGFQTYLLIYPASVYAGLFLIWGSVFFYFSGEKGRRILFILVTICLAVSLVNYFAFNVKPAFFYADLTFDGELNITTLAIILNLIVSILFIALLLWGWKKHPKIMKNLCVIIAVSLGLLGAYNSFQITQALNGDLKTENHEDSDLKGVLSLSRKEKNIVVLMLDRALGSDVPYIFAEKPELAQAFEGFVYYPNTLSYGISTINGAPPLYGGYEYIPSVVIGREESDLSPVKQEALKMLPVLFYQNGFETIVADPPLFDISIYNEHADITALNLSGSLNAKYTSLKNTDIIPVQRRNFVMYSLFKTVPLFMREKVYDGGGYLAIESKGYTQAFIDNYAVLDELSNLTSVNDNRKGSFLFLQNATAHEPTVLEAPDYEISSGNSQYQIPYGERQVNGRTMKLNNLDQWKTYGVNMVTYMELAQWLQTLKKYDVYDNTRIILVADHGADIPPQFDDMVLPEGFNIESANPLLMVKDFNARGPMDTSMAFMTNADVATLATDGVIENPVNPFTGNRITSEEKNSGSVMIPISPLKTKVSLYEKLAFDDYIWWCLKGNNIFDLNNWEKIVPEGVN